MKNKEPAQYRAAGGVRYEFKRKRVKNINLRVRADGSVAVSAPLGAPLAQVDAFVAGRARWIEAARVRALARGEEEQRPCSVSREDALALFTQVSDAVFPLFAQVLNGQRPVLKVRQMKTRWGVCVPEALPCRRPWARRWHRWMHSWPDGLDGSRRRACALLRAARKSSAPVPCPGRMRWLCSHR